MGSGAIDRVNQLADDNGMRDAGGHAQINGRQVRFKFFGEVCAPWRQRLPPVEPGRELKARDLPRPSKPTFRKYL